MMIKIKINYSKTFSYYLGFSRSYNFTIKIARSLRLLVHHNSSKAETLPQCSPALHRVLKGRFSQKPKAYF